MLISVSVPSRIAPSNVGPFFSVPFLSGTIYIVAGRGIIYIARRRVEVVILSFETLWAQETLEMFPQGCIECTAVRGA